MAVHLIKLCVGVDSLAELAAWQKQRLRTSKNIMHITRWKPKRDAEVLDGGSIYWVINGWVIARQKLLGFKDTTRDGTSCCGLVLDKKLIKVRPLPRKAFQGWRYLEAKDAPPDIDLKSGVGDLPEDLRRELAELGLL